MLDEWKEYQEYNDDYSKRLAPRRLCNHLTGTSRALEVIARFYLFHGNNTDLSVTQQPPEDPMVLTDNLRSWANGWLVNYAERLWDNKETLEQIKKAIKGANARWSKTNPWNDSKTDGNNFNQIYYQTIFASALDRGPLKKRILIENENLFDTFVNNDGTECKSPIASQTNYLLKKTAAYLLNNPLKQNSVLLCEADLLNWCSIAEAPKKSFYILENDTPVELFKKTEAIGSGNYVKFRASKRWLANYSLWDITAPGSLEDWVNNPLNKGKTYYVDHGSGYPLEKHTI